MLTGASPEAVAYGAIVWAQRSQRLVTIVSTP